MNSDKDEIIDEQELNCHQSLSICVVVPTYNAEHEIAECLGALFQAGFAGSEIIVSDDGSIDNTVPICRDMGVRTILAKKNTGAGQARNRGAEVAKSDVILFVDADLEVAEDVRERILTRFADECGLDALFGSYDDTPTRPEPVSRIRNLLHHHVHQQNAGPSSSFWTGLGAIRRDVFKAVGQFNPDVRMMEDIELGMRLYSGGYRVELDPSIQGTHRKRWSLWQMLNTDLKDRAIPWTQLMRTDVGRNLPPTLNVSAAGKQSVLAVGISIIGLFVTLLMPLTGTGILAASLIALFHANSAFLVKVRKRDGWLQGVRAFGVLWLHYGCAGLGFALVHLGFRS